MSTTRLALMASFTGALLLSAGCDDDSGGGTPDASLPGNPDAATPDGDVPTPDAAPPGTPTPQVHALSPAGTDGFFGVTYDKDGNLFAAGHIAPTTEATADRAFVVAKILPTGALDTAFGEGGFATKNVAVGGGSGETARPIVAQSTGKIIVGGTIEHDVAATGALLADRDIALVRFNADGSIDEEFGEDGVVKLDVGTGLVIANNDGTQRLAGADAIWSLSVTPDDKIVVHGATRAAGTLPDNTTPRSDTDWLLMRLNADGTPDTGFGTGGKFTLDIETGNASARGAVLLADGSIIGAGYANTPSVASTQAVLYKVTPAGVLDTEFGVGGVFYQVVLGATTEAYAAGLQNGKIVTVGYGRNLASESLDFVSLRVSADGELDSSWGQSGALRIDVAGFSDQGRNLVVLPDSRVLFMGGGEATMGQKDAMLALVGTNGQVDTTLGASGYKLWDLGGSVDNFWAGAVSPDGKTVALAGMKGAGSMPSATNNDDAAIFIMPLEE